MSEFTIEGVITSDMLNSEIELETIFIEFCIQHKLNFAGSIGNINPNLEDHSVLFPRPRLI